MPLGRRLLLLATGVLSAFLIFGATGDGDMASAWKKLGVPAMSPSFADLRTITHSIECKQKGIDPYRSRSCDPWKRLYNYPPIWLELGKFSVGSELTNAIGLTLAAFFVLALLLIVDLRCGISAWLLLLASFSPPVLLGVERGNTDLLIFSLVVLLFSFVAPTGLRSSPVIFSIGVVILTILKIYPVALITSLVPNRTKGILFATSCALVSLVALLLTSKWHIIEVFENTPVSTWRSYGAAVIPIRLIGLSDIGVRLSSAVLAAALGTSLAVLMYRYKSVLLPRFDVDQVHGALATACGAIYCLTFLAGTNFDYRLVFLLPCILTSLRAFETSFDYKQLYFPVIVTAYLWATLLDSLVTDIISLFVFALIFSAVLLRLAKSRTVKKANLKKGFNSSFEPGQAQSDIHN